MKKAFVVFLYPFFLLTADAYCQENDQRIRREANEILEEALSLAEEYPEKAIVLAREVIDALEEKAEPKSCSQAYYILGEAYFYLDDLEKAIAFYKNAVTIDKKYGNDNSPQHINLLGNIGYFYDELDQKVMAQDYYQQALILARKLDVKEEIAANLSNIGQLKTLQGNFEEAIRYMEEALSIDLEIGDEGVIATDLNTLGRLYESWGLYDKAIDYLQRALDIDIRLGRQDRMAVRYNSMGLVYKSWEKYDQALANFQKAMEIDSRMDDKEKVALRNANIGSTYLAMGKADKAIEYLDIGLDYFIESNMTSYLASGCTDLGKAYFLKGNFKKAKEYLLRSLSISELEGYKTWKMDALETLTRVYSSSGDYEMALETYRSLSELKDSVFSEENRKALAEFQAKYELASQTQENELLKKNAELHRKQRMLIILVFSAAAFFLVSIMLALIVRLRNQQHRRQLSEKEKEDLELDLEIKHNELTVNAMNIIKSNETVGKMVLAIEGAIENGDDPEKLRQIVQRLQAMEHDNGWKEFEVRFTQTHRDFYDKLNERFPDLTPNEKKLCAFLRLNMSTKDIASITHQSVHSINVARTRLRKKLGIGQTDENLVNFLQNL